MAEAPMIELAPDPQEMEDLRLSLADAPREIPKVLSRAMNAAQRTMRARIGRIAAKQLGLKVGVVKKRVWAKKAKSSQLYARLVGGRVGWPVHGASMKQVTPGVEIRLGRIRFLAEHAFVATMPSGYASAWLRRGREHLPIQEVRTDSITDVVSEVSGLPEVISAGRETLTKRLNAETGRVLERLAKKRGGA